MANEEQAVVVQHLSVPARTEAVDSIGMMLAAAIDKGMDASSIERLVAVYERMEEKKAEREFNEALAAFQAECPVILKKTQIEFPTKSGARFTSRFAEMDDIVEHTRPLREKYGFSFSFHREITENDVKVSCIIRHRGGHQTITPFQVPIDKSNKLSDAHAIAGAVTFCERYAFRGGFGVTTGMPDNDGKSFTGGTITEEQQKTLQALIDEVKPMMEQFWSYCKVEKLEDLPARDFARVQRALMDKRKGGAK